jgi:hypothetical protein
MWSTTTSSPRSSGCVEGEETLLRLPLTDEIKVFHGLSDPSSVAVQLVPPVEQYRREYFEQAHDIFLGERMEEDGTHVPAKVCCMKRVPRKGFYDVLYLEGGLFRADKVAEHAVKGDGAIWLSLLSRANRALVWRCVPEGHASILRSQLLVLEARIGPRRMFPVGVVFGAHDQALEEEMFKNDVSCINDEFLNAMGEEIDEANWLHYGSDYLAAVESHKAYYTSYCSYELLFHVAPLLSEDERRQYLGNDKVVIYCLKNGSQAFIPRFRGDVNSIGIVCRPTNDDDGDTWDVSVFIRSRVDNFEPVFSRQCANASQLRRTVLSLAIRGYQAVTTSPPYLALLAKSMACQGLSERSTQRRQLTKESPLSQALLNRNQFGNRHRLPNSNPSGLQRKGKDGTLFFDVHRRPPQCDTVVNSRQWEKKAASLLRVRYRPAAEHCV